MLWQQRNARAYTPTRPPRSSYEQQEHDGQARWASKFKRPLGVVETTGIPSGAKLSILKAWETDCNADKLPLATPYLRDRTNLYGTAALERGSRKEPAVSYSERREVPMRPNILFTVHVGTLVPASSQQGALPQGNNLETPAIEQATGLKGHLIAESNVFKGTRP